MLRWLGRTALSVLGGAVLLGAAWWAVSDSQQQARIRKLEMERAELERVIERLKTTRRVAQILVTDQETGPDGRVLRTRMEFKEFDRGGKPLPVRKIEVPSDTVYVDALVVRFEDSKVEQGDRLRGQSLHLFRRVFGDRQPPVEGQVLDRPNEVPAAYRTDDEPGAFERQLWKRFWEYAADPEAAAAFGVRVAQGEAVYQRVRTGQMWELAIRADAGLEFKPVAVDPLIQPHLAAPRETQPRQ